MVSTPPTRRKEGLRHDPERQSLLRTGSAALPVARKPTATPDGGTPLVKIMPRRPSHGPSVWRWWALFLFCLLGMAQNVAWIIFSTIIDDARQYYSFTDSQVNRLVEIATITFIPSVFIFSPMSDRYGLKLAFVVSCFTVFAGGVCRWLGPQRGGPAWRDPFMWMMIGQGLNGMAGPIVMNAPPQLAAMWFPPRQRATATAIAWSSQAVGVSIGFYLAPVLVSTPDDIPNLMLNLTVQGGVLFLLSLTLPRAPPAPPSKSAATKKLGFFGGLRQVWSLSFSLLAVSWAFSGGALAAWQSMLEIFLDGRFPDTMIGRVGAIGQFAGMTGSLIVPAAIDALGWQRRLKPAVFLVLTGLTGTAALFLYLVYYEALGVPLWLIGIALGANCFCCGAISPLALELAAEITFPASEETAAAYMSLLYNLFNLGLMEAANAAIGGSPCSGSGLEWYPHGNSRANPSFSPIATASACSDHCNNVTGCEFFTYWEDPNGSAAGAAVSYDSPYASTYPAGPYGTGGEGRCSLSATGALLRLSANATFAGPKGCVMDAPLHGGRSVNWAIVAIYAICAILVLPVSSGNRRIAIDMADEGQDGPECEATNTRGLPELEAAGSIQ